MVSPDSGEGSKTSWGFNVANQSDNLEGRGLDDGDGFDLLFLIELGLDSVDISEDVGHSCLEASEGSEVGSLGGVVSGE